MFVETIYATIRNITKSINPGEGYAIDLNNAQGASFVAYISKKERCKYSIGDIVELHIHEELIEDDAMFYEKIGKKVG